MSFFLHFGPFSLKDGPVGLRILCPGRDFDWDFRLKLWESQHLPTRKLECLGSYNGYSINFYVISRRQCQLIFHYTNDNMKQEKMWVSKPCFHFRKMSVLFAVSQNKKIKRKNKKKNVLLTMMTSDKASTNK